MWIRWKPKLNRSGKSCHVTLKKDAEALLKSFMSSSSTTIQDFSLPCTTSSLPFAINSP